MNTSGRIIGIILISGSLLLLAAVGTWLVVGVLPNSPDGALLGGILALIVLGPIAGVGVFLLVQSSREERMMAEVSRQRKLLSIVRAQGKITIADAALELDANYDQVKDWIYDLVGKGLFSGYINWDEGVLHSHLASQLRDETHCKHCGGELSLAGKGIVSCPYCGTEYFLS